MPKVNDLPTYEERLAATENMRRESRFRFAEKRIRAIVDAAPPLTPEQRDRLAAILRPVAGDAA